MENYKDCYTQKECNGVGVAKKCYCKECMKSFKVYIPCDGLERGDFPPYCKFCGGYDVVFVKK